MRLTSALLLPLAAFAMLGGFAISCGGSNGGGGAGGDTGTADCSTYGEVGESPACSSQCAVANEEFCAGVSTTPDCDDLRPGADIDVCGVGMRGDDLEEAGNLVELERSPNVDEFAGTGAPDLGCYSTAGFPSAPGASETVTLTGVAKIFSHGCESKNLEVTVFEVIRDGSADEGMPGNMIGSTVMTAGDCTLEGEPEENEDCTDAKFDGSRWECRYTYAGVPSETELLIVTEGTGWAPLYEYNVYAPNAEVVDGVFEKDIRALAQDDYQLIPQTAIGKNIESGNGAVGGEVHDCGDVRLINAIVDIDKPRVLTYFTDDELAPLPDVSAQSTSTLGLYAALDVPTGPVNVAAAGIVDGKLVGVGFFRARVFANAVTSVTFRGLRPFQLAQ
jgi:hypothetical protein